ncbi:MAG: HAD-IA family hydrolase [Chthonomonas sp.]|nr:HAD-IA family hydrolase [Chthonomonas sp.]
MTFPELLQGKTAILFDVDGTLVDTMEMLVAGLGDSFEHFSGRRPPREELLAMMGVALREQMDYYGMDQRTEETNAERCHATVDNYMRHRETQRIYQETVDALQLAQSLGYRTALVTSRNHRELAELFHDFPVLQQVDSAISSSDVVHPKPAPDSALLACDRLGVLPEEAVMLGDSKFDMGCAQSAGVLALAVTYGAGDPNDLAPFAPAWTFRSPAEVLRAFQELTPLCEPRKLANQTHP